MSIFVRASLRLLAGFTVLYLLLFVLTGDPLWPQGWVLWGLLAIFMLGNMLVLRRDPGLLEERMQPILRRGQPGSDRILLLLFVASYGAWYLLMPLEHRLHPARSFPLWLQAGGTLLLIGGSALIMACFAQNSYLSSVVRIQSERGHQLVDSGLYAVIRHPMYLGILCLMCGAGLLLSSRWGIVTAVLGGLILYLRAIEEEKLLQAQLPGYAGYMQRVRRRMFPWLL
ncbi:MAG: isoprenylcysteine carboxylmethyltransferase family protein [bacterium]